MNSAILLGYVKHVWEDDCRGHFHCRFGLEFSGPDFEQLCQNKKQLSAQPD